MSNVYLPAPSLTAKDWGPTAAEISAVAGPEVAEPFTTREQARRAAEHAIGDLTDNRPGGTTWKAAEAADTTAVAAGKPATAIAKLIDGDAQRYGQAVATVAAHKHTANTLKDNLDRAGLEAAIREAKTEHGTEWAKIANQAWGARADHQKTFKLYRDGQQHLSRWRVADHLAAWLEGRRRHQQTDPATWRREHQLPDDRFARGAWLCTELILDPSEKWWHLPLPEDVAWPLDGWPLVEKALQPSAVHAVNGGAEVEYSPAGTSSSSGSRGKSGADRLARDLGISA